MCTCLLVDDAGQVKEMQKWLNAETVGLAKIMTVPRARIAALVENVCQYGRSEVTLSAARALIGREQRFMSDFAEWICTGYTSLMCAQASSYGYGQNGFLRDAQLDGEYLGCYCIRVGEYSHLFHVDETDNDEERTGSKPRPQGDGGPEVEFVLHRQGIGSFLCSLPSFSKLSY